jgi:hypothetical protein
MTTNQARDALLESAPLDSEVVRDIKLCAQASSDQFTLTLLPT